MRLFWPLILVALLLVVCTEEGSDDPLELGSRCAEDDECESPFVCVYGLCRAACTFDRDCPEGGACVALPDNSGARVCTIAAESDCRGETPCPDGLECGPDGTCREPCSESCGEGRICLDGLCVEYPGGSGGDADG